MDEVKECVIEPLKHHCPICKMCMEVCSMGKYNHPDTHAEVSECPLSGLSFTRQEWDKLRGHKQTVFPDTVIFH